MSGKSGNTRWYMPVHLYNTFWSIAVASAEQDVLSGLDLFQKQAGICYWRPVHLRNGVFDTGAKAWFDSQRGRKTQNRQKRSFSKARIV